MAASMTLKSRVIRFADTREEDIAAWRSLLARAAPQGNAFLSPAFARAASTYRPVEVALIEDENGLAAVLPFQFNSRSAEILRAGDLIGEEMSDSCGLIAREDFRCEPKELLHLAKLSYFYFTHLEESQQRHGLKGQLEQSGLRINLPRGGEAYWAELGTTSGKFVKDTERRLRRAEQDLGPIRFTFAEGDRATWLKQLIAAKRAQYMRTKSLDWLGYNDRTRLLEALIAQNDTDCQPIISTLHFGDHWVATHLGLRAGQTLHYWLPVYNPEMRSFAAGRLLLQQIITHAEHEGVTAIDRGAGESEAKLDFPSSRKVYTSGTWFLRTPQAFAFRAWRSLTLRLEKMARRRSLVERLAETSHTQPGTTFEKT